MTSTALPALGNCPFCGGEVHWCGTKLVGSDDYEHECHHITCPNCGDFDLVNGDDAETFEALRAICAARWNKRAGAANLVSVAVAPDEALLACMALRVDQDFGGRSEGERKVLLSKMRAAYEEVVGKGYFRLEERSRYVGYIPKANSQEDGSNAR